MANLVGRSVLQERIEPVFVRHGLNGGEYDVLAALRRAGPPFRLSPSALSQSLIVTSGGMTKRLKSLEDAGRSFAAHPVGSIVDRHSSS